MQRNQPVAPLLQLLVMMQRLMASPLPTSMRQLACLVSLVSTSVARDLQFQASQTAQPVAQGFPRQLTSRLTLAQADLRIFSCRLLTPLHLLNLTDHRARVVYAGNRLAGHAKMWYINVRSAETLQAKQVHTWVQCQLRQLVKLWW